MSDDKDICSIEGCVTRVGGEGLCMTHFRARDTVGSAIPEELDSAPYDISDDEMDYIYEGDED